MSNKKFDEWAFDQTVKKGGTIFGCKDKSGVNVGFVNTGTGEYFNLSDGDKMKLRVWWIPQMPCEPFHIDVNSVAEGAKMMDVLADYDLFQFDNNIKGDYCNTGGLQLFDTEDTEDSPQGSWVDWYDEETGEDDPRKWLVNDDAVTL